MTIDAGSEKSHSITMVFRKKTYDFRLLHILGTMTYEHTVTYPYGDIASMMGGYFVNAYPGATVYDLSTLDTISEYLVLADFPKSECDIRLLNLQ